MRLALASRLALSVVWVTVAGSGCSYFSSSSCPSGKDSPVPVLVAKQLIEKATPGAVIVTKRLYATAAIPCADRKPGAFADAADILGRETVVDLFPGQQLTKADFASK